MIFSSGSLTMSWMTSLIAEKVLTDLLRILASQQICSFQSGARGPPGIEALLKMTSKMEASFSCGCSPSCRATSAESRGL